MRPIEFLRPSTVDPSRPDAKVICAIGWAQVVSWGSTYYLTAVFAQPMADEMGWPLAWVVGGLSLGLIASGLAAPRIGRLIARHGGRPILAAGALLLAAGLILLAATNNLGMFYLAWVTLGLGMACSLYDASFATLGTLYGARARPAIAAVTLFGGFASTVCWPLSAWLIEQAGWRGALLIYAAYHLVVTLPLLWFQLPRREKPVAIATITPGLADAQVTEIAAPPPAPTQLLPESRRLWLLVVLGAAFTCSSFITASFAVHLLTLLQARGMDLTTAVALGATIGPSQVAGRAIEMALGRNIHPVWTMAAAASLIVIGLALVIAGMPLAAAGFVAYGAGIGVTSIAKGAAPLALFGAQDYAVIVGRLAMPSLIAQALAPLAVAGLLFAAGPDLTLVALFALATITLALSALVIRMAGASARIAPEV